MLRYFFLSFSLEAIVATVCPYFQIMLRNKGFSQSVVGVVMALGQVFAMFMPLTIGLKIDKTGHLKSIWAMCVLIAMISFRLFALQLPFWLSLVFFILGTGCAACFNPTLDTYFSNNLKGDPESYGKIRSVGTLGYMLLLIFATLSGFPNQTDNKQIALNIVLVGLMFLLSLRIAPDFSVKHKLGSQSKFIDFKWFDKSFYIFIGIVVVFKLGMSAIEMLLGSYMIEVLNLKNNFTIFIAVGAFSEFIMMFVAGRWVKNNKMSVCSLFFLSIVALIVRLLMYAFTKSIVAFVIAQCLHSFTFGCNHIAISTFISRTVDKKHLSVATSIYWAIGCNFTQLIGSLFGGFIIDYLGYYKLFIIYSLFPAISAVLLIRFKKLISTALGEN